VHDYTVQLSTVRPHHASATGAALASSSTSGRFQDGHPGLPATVRHGSSLSGRRLPVGLRRRSSSAAFCHIEDEPTATMETGVLQLQVRSCGTAFQVNCDKLTLAFNDLIGY